MHEIPMWFWWVMATGAALVSGELVYVLCLMDDPAGKAK